MIRVRRERYFPGAVVFRGMSIRHEMVVIRGVAVFRHEEHSGEELLLEGRPTLYDDQRAYARRRQGWGSEVKMSCTIPADAVPGVYTLNRIYLATGSGRSIDYGPVELNELLQELGEQTAAIFEVVEEPTDRPVIESIGVY
jgi:hypothetical protein